MGIKFFPVIGWAERGGGLADGHGNSVPRFHITWGTGPGVVAPFDKRVREHIQKGNVTYKPRHQVDDLIVQNNEVTGVSGTILIDDPVERGEKVQEIKQASFNIKAIQWSLRAGE